MRLWAKRAIQGCFLLYALPAALLCGLGRIEILYAFFAQAFAILPGFIGSFSRAAFYKLTLDDCSIDVVIGLGSYFSRSSAIVGPNVSIGGYCIIGEAHIGARSQISSHVEIPGGRTQHVRDASGRLSDTIKSAKGAPDARGMLTIGEDCWIGASAIVMANVGAQSTIGAGSVVVRDIPSGVVAVGSPAKPIKSSYQTE
jgi:virginiamycin A acetyltransferase